MNIEAAVQTSPVQERERVNLIEVSKAYAKERVNAGEFVESLLFDEKQNAYRVPFTEALRDSSVPDGFRIRFYVHAKATSEDLSEMMDLMVKIKELQSRVDEIKADILADAELELCNTAYTSYYVGVPNGTVEVSNKVSIDILSAQALQRLLKDERGELITPKPISYSVNTVVSQVLSALANNLILDQLPVDFINGIAEQLGDASLKYEHTCKALKKTFTANKKVFMNTFGMTAEEAEDTATMYQMSLNYELFCKLASCAGYDVRASDWADKRKAYAEQLLDTVVVKQLASLTAKIL